MSAPASISATSLFARASCSWYVGCFWLDLLSLGNSKKLACFAINIHTNPIRVHHRLVSQHAGRPQCVDSTFSLSHRRRFFEAPSSFVHLTNFDAPCGMLPIWTRSLLGQCVCARGVHASASPQSKQGTSIISFSQGHSQSLCCQFWLCLASLGLEH